MNILKRITATSILAISPFFGTGCNSQGIKEYRLSHLGTMHVSNMAVFDKNNDNTLSLEEAEEYIKSDIFKGTQTPTREELHKIIEIAAHVRRAGSQKNLQTTSKNLLEVHSRYMKELCERENKK